MDQVSQQILWDKTPKRTSWGDFSEVLGWNDAHGITNFSSTNCVSIYPDKAWEVWKELTLRKIYNWALARAFQKVSRRFENTNLVSLNHLPLWPPCPSKSLSYKSRLGATPKWWSITLQWAQEKQNLNTGVGVKSAILDLHRYLHCLCMLSPLMLKPRTCVVVLWFPEHLSCTVSCVVHVTGGGNKSLCQNSVMECQRSCRFPQRE